MSESLKSLAKRKMLEAKQRAKEEERKAKEILKSKKLEEKEREWRLNQQQKEAELLRKEFAKKVKSEILTPYYKNRENELHSDGLYIGRFEDGNIVGKNGNEYFYSYQKDDLTYIRVFANHGQIRISDGDQYPLFKTVDLYKAQDIAINSFGNPIPDTVRYHNYTSFEFGRNANKIVEEYNKLDSLAKDIDERVNKLNNTAKR